MSEKTIPEIIIKKYAGLRNFPVIESYIDSCIALALSMDDDAGFAYWDEGQHSAEAINMAFAAAGVDTFRAEWNGEETIVKNVNGVQFDQGHYIRLTEWARMTP